MPSGSFGGSGAVVGVARNWTCEDTLRSIADETGGEYFYAATRPRPEKIYSNLGLNLVLKLEKVELTAWFTAAAGLFLVSVFVLSILWRTFN